MPSPALQVEGAKTLRATLKRAGIGVQDLKDAHRQVADLVLAAGRPFVPVASGRLRNSGRASGTQTVAQVRYGGARIPYAGVQHWGWPRRNIPAKPWAADAAARTQGTWEGTYLAALEKIIDTVEGAPGP
jgi:hypothetical protein